MGDGMDAIDTKDEAARRRAAEDARADARGMAFLVGMLVAGGLTVAATLTLSDGPATAGSTQAAVVTAR